MDTSPSDIRNTRGLDAKPDFLSIVSQSPDLGERGETASIHKLTIPSAHSSSDANAGKTAQIHIYQYQPTGRPIEDRFSITLFPDYKPNGIIRGSKILLAVYDGHRGPWAAEYIADALPARVLSVLRVASDASSSECIGGDTALPGAADQDTIGKLFEEVDREMLATFQDAHRPIREVQSSSQKKSVIASLASKLWKHNRDGQSLAKSDVVFSVDPRLTLMRYES